MCISAPNGVFLLVLISPCVNTLAAAHPSLQMLANILHVESPDVGACTTPAGHEKQWDPVLWPPKFHLV